ncbi:MAG TPA: carboxypeptidase-like regulatory domain-containing protein, partial [Thermoanaerobaculia bacterium]|nr:carboxypeptidase-like regulatory domain-containing protein [Thermoanaerobaculia bacterium]
MTAPQLTAPATSLLLILLAAARPAAAAETLTGLVVPPTAAARARVELWPACPPDPKEAARAQPLAAVRPGADGRFRIAAPDGESLRLRVEAEGFLPAERPVDPEETDLPPLRLGRAETLEVALAGPDGGPLAGVRLFASPAPSGAPDRDGDRGWSTPEDRAVTGPDGRALFRRRPGQPLTLFVAAPSRLGVHTLGPGSPQRLVLAPGRPVTLRATDVQGRPVAGARVRPWGAEQGDEIGRTGPDGRLELGAPDGTARVMLVVDDGAGRQTEVTIGPDAERSLTAVLRPARQVAGRVIDAATRQPVAGARVEASCSAATRSGPDGGFRIALGPRDTHLSARAAGYLPAGLWLQDPGAAGPFTLALERAGALVVRVVDEAGAPVAGAQVRALPEGPGALGPGEIEATSGQAGTARLAVPALAGARFQLTAEREGFAPARAVVRLPAEPGAQPMPPMPPIVLVLTRGATAAGRLTTEQGEGLAGGTVELEREAEHRGFFDPPTALRQAAAGPDGRFELRHLPPGRFRLTARAPGHAPAARLPVEIPAGAGRVDLGNLALAAGAALEGRVVDERDRPLEGAAVLAVDGPGEPPRALTGADGRFRLADLAPGRANLWVVREGYIQTTLHDIAVPSGEPLAIRLRPARVLTGQVVGPRGEPVAGAMLHRLTGGAGADGSGFSGSSSLAHTDAQGRFRADGLEPGPVALLAEAPGYRSRRLQVEIPAERDAGPLEIALDTGAVIEGRVLAAGKPMAQAQVSAHPTVRVEVHAGTLVQTDGDGRFRLAGLAVGRHAVEVTTADGRQAREEVEVRPGTQQLDLHLPAAEISGRVVDAAGRPVAAAALRLVGPRSGVIETAADGSFAFRSLPPGTYLLAASHPEAGRADLSEVQVAERPVVLPDLVLENADELATVSGRLVGLAPRDLAQAQVVAHPAVDPGGPAETAPPGLRRSAVVARLNADGTYRLVGLAPGAWQIHATAGERRPLSRQLRLAAGEQAAVDLEFAAGATLSGRVTLDGQPAAELQVLLSPEGG